MHRYLLPLLRPAFLWGVLFSLTAGVSNAQNPEAGAIDGSFSTSVDGTVLALAVQPDGRILVGGSFTSVGGQPRDSIARLNPDGSVETTATFNPGSGVFIEDGDINSIAVQPDGRILLGGSFREFDGQSRNGVARLNADGTLESTATFNIGTGIGPEFDYFVSSVVVQPDGQILVGGGFDTFNGQPRRNLVRLNPNGSVESTATFNPGSGPESVVRSIVVQPDGQILIGGGFSAVDGQERNGFARLNPNGSVNLAIPEFAPRPQSNVNSILLQPDGKILLAGFLSQIIENDGPARLIRINPDTTLESPDSFNPVTIDEGSIDSMALQADGKILLGGTFSNLSGEPRNRIARLNPNGSVESISTFFSSGPEGFGVFSLAQQANGRILAGGSFETFGGASISNLARLNNNPAVEALNVPGPERVEWLRSGTAPEAAGRVTFELSPDGNTWSPLGVGSRIAGGWELTGLSLPGSGLIRARARTSGGSNNSSSGWVETVQEYAFPVPQLVVEQPVESVLDNGEPRDFGNVQTGAFSELVFIIRNAGNADLNISGVTVSGADAASFTITDPPDSVVGESSTSFTVRFAPVSPGLKSAELQIATNDPDNNPFLIPVTGTGLAPPVVSFTAAASQRPESGELAQITVQLSAPAGLDVTIPFTVAGTASAADAEVSDSPLVISAGGTGGVINITLIDDALFEGDETVVITMGNPVNGTLGTPAEHTLTIIDDEAAPLVNFSQAASTAAEGAGVVNVPLTLSGASATDISVPFTLSGTALAGADYNAPTSPVVIPAGTLTAVISIDIQNDLLDEVDETAAITLGPPAGAALGTVTGHNLNITDDDNPPSAAFAAATQSAPESGGNISLTVQLSAPSGLEVTVPVIVGLPSVAVLGTDFEFEGGSVVIPAGSMSGSVGLTVLDDALDEMDETVELLLGTPVNATLGTPAALRLTILDNDLPPVVSFAVPSSEFPENAGGVAPISAQLSAPSALDVRVDWAITGTATQGADFTGPVSGTFVFLPGETAASYNPGIVDDLLAEDDETIVITMANPLNATLGAISTQTLVILDNDAPPSVNLTVSSPVLEENGGVVTINLELNAPSGVPVTVTPVLGGTAVAGTDFNISAPSVTLPPGQVSAAVTLTAIDNNVADPDKTILVSLGTPVNAVPGALTEASVTLRDDDTAKNILSVTAPAPVTEAAAGGVVLEFLIQLTRGADGPVSAQYQLSGTATPGVDYAGAAAGVVTFAAGETVSSVVLTVQDDNIYEPAESVILTLSGPVGSVVAGDPGVATILDDESVPVLTVGDAGWLSDAGPGGAKAVFPLRLSGPSSLPVTVPWQLLSGSAQQDADFAGGSGSVVFPPGSQRQQVMTGVIPDAREEGAETFFFQARDPDGAVFAGSPDEPFYLNQTLSPVVDAGSFIGRCSSLYGETLAIGAPLANGGRGEVVVFVRNPDGGLAPWAETARLVAPDGVEEDQFGSSVHVWSEWMVVGAIRRDGTAEDAGAAYVFRRSGAGWTFLQRLEAADGAKNNYFGWAVSGHGSTLAVSARLHRTGRGPRGDEGAIYIYHLVNGKWTFQTKLVAEDPNAQSLGGSLSLYGDILAAGAPDDDGIQEDAGAVYLFGRNVGGPDQWGLVKKVQRADGPVGFQQFGTAVHLWEGTLAAGSASGAGIQIFDRQAGGPDAWGSTAHLDWNGAVPEGGFGSVLCLNGDLLAAGAPGATGPLGKNQGAAYLFRRNAAGTWLPILQLQDPGAAAEQAFGSAMTAWGGELAVGSLNQGNGQTHLFRDHQGVAFIFDGPPGFGANLEILPDGRVSLSWEPQAGALRYQVQSSTDLLDWQNEADVLPPDTEWTGPVPAAPRIYYRIITYY